MGFVLTIAWTGTTCSNPPMLSISVRPERYSYHMIEETGEFVVSIFQMKFLPGIHMGLVHMHRKHFGLIHHVGAQILPLRHPALYIDRTLLYHGVLLLQLESADAEKPHRIAVPELGGELAGRPVDGAI